MQYTKHKNLTKINQGGQKFNSRSSHWYFHLLTHNLSNAEADSNSLMKSWAVLLSEMRGKN